MKEAFILLAGGAVGAVIAYLFDAKSGRERRNLMRDRVDQAKEQVQHQAEAGAQEIKALAGEAREAADAVATRAH